MSELERVFKKNKELEKEILLLRGIEKEKKKSIPSYQFSKVTDTILENLFDIEQIIDREKFNNWFDNSLILDEK